MKKLIHKLINLESVKNFLTSRRWIVQLYFDFLYRKPDPYKVASGAEVKKFDHAFSLLGNRYFEQGIEIGCGEGFNTWRVAKICKKVLALDISLLAIRRARKNNPLPNIEFTTFDVTANSQKTGFDYVFCSETLYYLHINQLEDAIQKIISMAKKAGVIHLLHSRSLKDDDSGLALKEFGAKTIHEQFIAHHELKLLSDEQTNQYRITILQRR
jgi:SAM-dependent methyltransferase